MKILPSIENPPTRLLCIGLLLTVLLGAVAARPVFPQLTFWEAGIPGVILAPTNAGLGQVVVQSPHMPIRVRRALNVEAGRNDGISDPFLLFFMALTAAKVEGGFDSLVEFIVEQLGFGV